jgi:hypothetical protein
MAARLAGQGDAQEVALQAAEGEVLEEGEGELHPADARLFVAAGNGNEMLHLRRQAVLLQRALLDVAP